MGRSGSVVPSCLAKGWQKARAAWSGESHAREAEEPARRTRPRRKTASTAEDRGRRSSKTGGRQAAAQRQRPAAGGGQSRREPRDCEVGGGPAAR